MTARKLLLIFLLISSGAFAVFYTVGLNRPPSSAVPKLPDGKGVEMVRAHCTACHSPRLILQNRMSRKNWDKTITWMQEKQNLWAIPPDTRKIILDYLEEKLSPVAADSMDGLGPRRVNPLPTPQT